MDYKEWLDRNKEDVLESLPRHTYGNYSVGEVTISKPGLYKGKAKHFIGYRNIDATPLRSVRGVMFYIVDDYTLSFSERIRALFDVDINGNVTGDGYEPEYNANGVTIIDKFAIVPAGVFKAEIPNRNPDSLADSISSLLYYLEKNDVTSAYQVMRNVSTDTKNVVSENKFASTKTVPNIQIKVKPWQL